jgi:hypothetical protein
LTHLQVMAGGGFEPASLEAEEGGRQFGPGANVIKLFFCVNCVIICQSACPWANLILVDNAMTLIENIRLACKNSEERTL